MKFNQYLKRKIISFCPPCIFSLILLVHLLLYYFCFILLDIHYYILFLRQTSWISKFPLFNFPLSHTKTQTCLPLIIPFYGRAWQFAHVWVVLFFMRYRVEVNYKPVGKQMHHISHIAANRALGFGVEWWNIHFCLWSLGRVALANLRTQFMKNEVKVDDVLSMKVMEGCLLVWFLWPQP